MKNILLILTALLAGFCFNSCDDTKPTQPEPIDSTWADIDCPPLPRIIPTGPFFPAFQHMYSCVSPDGSKLAYLREGGGPSVIHILDLRTGEDRAYPEVFSTIPAPWKLVGGTVVDWCPYDNNRVLLNCAVSTRDPITNRSRVGNALFVYALDGSEFQRLPFSTCDSMFQISSYCKWLPISTSGNDIFTIGAVSTSSGAKPKCILSGFYYWQENRFQLYDSATKNTSWVYNISKNGTYILSLNSIVPDTTMYYVNSKRIFFEESDKWYHTSSTSFSPNESRLAIVVYPDDSALPMQKRRFDEIRIFRIEDLLKSDATHPTKPERIINIRRNFCMYSGGYTVAKYMTDASLAVSMFKDQGEAAFIYEISTEGKMLRQLTTKP